MVLLFACRVRHPEKWPLSWVDVGAEDEGQPLLSARPEQLTLIYDEKIILADVVVPV